MIAIVSEGFSFRVGMVLADLAMCFITLAVLAIICIIFFAVGYWIDLKANKGGEK